MTARTQQEIEQKRVLAPPPGGTQLCPEGRFMNRQGTLRSISLQSPMRANTEVAGVRVRIVLVQTQAEGAGAQEISRILGGGLEARGHDIHHLFLYRRTSIYDDQPNTFFCARERPRGILSFARMVRALMSQLRRLQPEVVVCFQHYGNLIGTIAARLGNVNTVIANRTTSKQLTPPVACWLEHLFGVMGLFDRIVVNCGTIANEYQGRYGRYRARVVRIDHGFEPKFSHLDRGAARALFNLPADVTLLGSVGRLHPSKNLAAAIATLKLEPQWCLALAGQGPAREGLTGLIASLGVEDRVYFLGELPPDRVGAFLRTLDVFVFPSLAETFGLAAVEAAQAGLPIVANTLDVLHEVLAFEGRPCALFVDAADTANFAGAIRRLLMEDDLREALTSSGKRLSERYSLGAMVQKYASLIEELAPSCAGCVRK